MSTIHTHLGTLAPGSRARGQLIVGRMASGREIAVPYLLTKGVRPGPCLWVSGNVHGDEINGSMAAIRLHQRLAPQLLAGTLVVTPTGNPLAFDAREKHTPQDGQDLDQAFPGRADGLITERLAAALFAEIATCADVVVSLHSIGWVMAAQPYAVYKLHPNAQVTEAELLACIACFEPALACRMQVGSGQAELPGNVAGALDYQCLALGKRAFMLEIGSARRLQMEIVERALAGFDRLAVHLGMRAGEPRAPGPICRVTRRAQVTGTQAGIFRALVAPGERAAAGTVLGETIDLHGDVVEQVRFAHDVLVIGIRAEPVLHFGDRTVFVATAWDEVRA